jgi:hypothetical protein
VGIICGWTRHRRSSERGQRIWLADINEGRSAEIFCVVRRIASKWPNMSHQRPPCA